MSGLRAMRHEDAPAVHALARRAFSALYPQPPETDRTRRAGLLRIEHLIGTDPEGAIVAERHDGTPEGAALALRREGLWGLSLLVIEPGVQSRGIGSRLLGRALATAHGARGALILSSDDPRALRLYSGAGFAPHPVLEAKGIVKRPPEHPGTVRGGSVDDRPLSDRVDRVVRGAPHGPDIDVELARGSSLLVCEDRGYALVAEDGTVRLLAALDVPAAQDLLRAALAAVPAGLEATVDWIGADQQWAVPVVLEAGLELRPGSAVFRRGDVGTFAPYLPSGAWL